MLEHNTLIVIRLSSTKVYKVILVRKFVDRN